MKKFFGSLFFICLIMLCGIADGLENGAPLTMLWWTVPIFLVMYMAIKIESRE